MAEKQLPVDHLASAPDTRQGEAHSIAAEKQDAQDDTRHSDIGLYYFQQSQLMDPVEREEIARRVLKKVDRALLPFVSSSLSCFCNIQRHLSANL